MLRTDLKARANPGAQVRCVHQTDAVEAPQGLDNSITCFADRLAVQYSGDSCDGAGGGVAVYLNDIIELQWGWVLEY